MFQRGSGSGMESKRSDESFYRGIVVKNNDPLKMNRVKVFIPEISNQPHEEWFENDKLSFKCPGTNTKEDNWNKSEIFEKIASNVPWAEPCFPLFGESGNVRYFSNEDINTITDANYEDDEKKFLGINDKPASIEDGMFSPAYLYENKTIECPDMFTKEPLKNIIPKVNTYGFNYRPSKHVNKTKGIIGVPEVGSKVWVFHYQGDFQFPIYFGVYQDQRSVSLMNDANNIHHLSNVYPGEFENKEKEIKTVIKV